MSGRRRNGHRRPVVVAVSRRDFLRYTGLTAGALVLGCRGSSDDGSVAGPPPMPSAVPAAEEGLHRLDTFVTVDTDGWVSIVVHRSEMGQGVRTSLPAVVADEMGASWDRVRVVQAEGDARYGSQNTDGSRSGRRFFQPLRESGASAREMLVAAAAGQWEVEPGECRAEEHQVIHEASGRSAGFGELAEAAAAQPVPDRETLALKSPDEWRYIGKPLPGIDGPDIVSGRAGFGIDARLPDMVHASIERCPVVGGKAMAWNEEAALAVPGVRQVIELPAAAQPSGFQPLGGIAVLADHTWAAIQGRKALAVQWDLGPNAVYDSQSFRRQLEATVAQPGKVARERGDVDAALAGAASRHTARYYAPHLSQSPIEPPAALARVDDDGCEVWACTQTPQAVRREVAGALGVEPETVTVHVTLLGGGFGRKSKPDFAVEAALLARQAGRPVKVTWTREDDIRHGYYHTVSCQQLEAGLDGEGRTVAWLQRSAFPSIGSTFQPGVTHASGGELGLGLTDLPFDVPALRLENGEAPAHLRIGWLRSVCNVFHAFAVGCFADELAEAAGADPKDYLLQLIGPARTVDVLVECAEGLEYSNYGDPLDTYPVDAGRLRGVVELVVERSGWADKRAAGRALGIAAHRSFLSYVATVAEVSIGDDGEPRVDAVHIACDCGTVLNSDRVHAQLEGGVVFGLALALHGKITASGGAIDQSNFHDYRLLRITETPRVIETYIVDSTEPPAGVGEPGVPPVAPAVANAIAAAGGGRRRELPLISSDPFA